METTAEQVAAEAGTPGEAAGNGEAAPPAAAPPAAEGPAAERSQKSARAAVTGQIDDLVAAVRRLEAFAADEAKRVSGKLVPQVEAKARQNIWMSLLIALGLGLLLGVWLTGGRRRD